MEALVKIDAIGKQVIKSECSINYFHSLMIKARKKYGLKTPENQNGFIWPNAHENIFIAGGATYQLEFLPEFDFFMFNKTNCSLTMNSTKQ